MKVLLIDDHPLFGFGFAQALSQGASGIEVLTAPTIQDGLVQAAAQPDLDIVLIDYRLGDTDGLAGLRHFGDRFPLVARVLISGDEDPVLAQRARAAGASGFLGKSSSLQGLLAALQRVADGEAVFDNDTRRATAGAGPTARQMEVLALLAQGQPNKRIALELGIAERTVKLHVTALLEALGARNRTHLLVRAREQGLL
ncbi:MAG: response regulator transcription factor [Hydrogenophaga sp.]|uniref:response regulator transcription factor n=1 Tax=Hydrogenophaga sp. TaxID=1904254 RepID=UPI00257DAD87|nr:response regulator transcription factor [Hydrogenophaga sp.]MBL0943614.1 response regulator transcription factor [Hydrogenophaga sp.]